MSTESRKAVPALAPVDQRLKRWEILRNTVDQQALGRITAYFSPWLATDFLLGVRRGENGLCSAHRDYSTHCNEVEVCAHVQEALASMGVDSADVPRDFAWVLELSSGKQFYARAIMKPVIALEEQP